jgi:hypothetical protein
MTEEQKEEVFLTKVRFAKMVENVRRELGLSYIESVIHLCEQHKIDEEDVKKYISDIIKQKIEIEAMDLNMLPKGNSLPF